MRRLTVALICVLTGILSTCSIASAAPPAPPSTWADHDTAVYVVSTLNLLRTPTGRPAVAVMQRRLGVTQFEVWKDMTLEGLYFIQLERSDGSIVGALAYRMGSAKPVSLVRGLTRLGAAAAPVWEVKAYRHDSKRLMATFSTTFPQ